MPQLQICNVLHCSFTWLLSTLRQRGVSWKKGAVESLVTEIIKMIIILLLLT